ncbi:hypothetical protein M426DRAFT_323666 [Hypoxylon sp. CI-4A]|nr:hypothetical protein M426DRAFT_323666 [Hypoxylon sp. CI-4A]
MATGISQYSTLALPTAADVIVIGAGLSGLQAAVNIQASSVSCIVLEANDRVGGKTLSVQSSSSKPAGKNDVGAAWVNDSNQSEIWKLFEKYGLGAEVQRTEGISFTQAGNGSVVGRPYGDELPDEGDDRHELLQLFEAINQAVEASDLEHPELGPDAQRLDSMTFAEFCRNVSPNTGETFGSMATAALLGVEAHEVSALYIINYVKSGYGTGVILSDGKDGAQNIRARRGMQTISENLANELTPNSLHLRTAVNSITQKEPSTYEIQTSTGVLYNAKHVVLSIPTSLYNSITFTPPLPTSKQKLADSTTLGYYSKVVLVYAHPWWRTANLSGVMDSEKGPVSFTRDTSVPEDDQWSLSCFLTGDLGRAWNQLPEIERKEAVLSQIRVVYSSAAAVPEPIAVHEQRWSEEPYFFGAPSPVMGPGVLTALGSDVFRESVGNIHFIGTETSIVWKGYMDGAIRSGQRGAEEVLESLRG